MSNTYFDASAVAIANGTRADAPDVNNVGSAVETGFGLLPEPDAIKQGRVNLYTQGGSANAYTFTTGLNLGSYEVGFTIECVIVTANTSSLTINADSVGEVAATYADGTALSGGEMTVGQVVTFKYDGSKFVWDTQSSSANAIAAAASAAAAASSETAAAASAAAAAAITPSIQGFDLLSDIYNTGRIYTASSSSTILTSIKFNDDGSSLYTLSKTSDTVHQYTLSRNYDILSTSYASKSVSVQTQEGVPDGMFFSSDGTKMYITGGNGYVYQYGMTTAWDVSTATYASISVDVSSQEVAPEAVVFSSDGAKMYTVGKTDDTVYQYTLSTAWDVSTATYASKSLSVSGQATNPVGLAFDADGTRLFVANQTDDIVYQYNLTTAWDVSTGGYASLIHDASTPLSTIGDVVFSNTGAAMYVCDASQKIIQVQTFVMV